MDTAEIRVNLAREVTVRKTTLKSLNLLLFYFTELRARILTLFFIIELLAKNKNNLQSA